MEVLARSLLENTHFPTTATLTVAILFVITVFFTRRCRGLFSRGPWGLPLLGFYPFLRKDFHVHLRELGKKYGEAYLMSICGKHYLHIGSHQAFREAIVERADCFSDRSQEIGFLQHLFKDGVSFINGDPWKVWHKFLLQSMRELHIVPKGEIEGPLLDAIKSTLSSLKENKGQPIDLSALLSLQCTEAVRRCIIGDRVSQETTLKLNQIYQKCTFLTGKKPALLCGSTARYLVLQWSKEFQELLSAKNEIDSILYAIINDHRLDFDPEHPRDLIDLYLKEKEMREKQNDPQAKYFNDKMFMGLLVLVYGESSYSLGALIAYYLKHLIGKTGVQNAIYEEIIREIGTEKLPNYNDRHKMPFTSSVVKEIQRMATHSPAEATRLATCDTTVSGVFVPEGTIVILNFYAINHDGAVYKNPDDFDPKRFMIEDKTKDSIPKSPVSFGSGKRACAGETLIKAEIFVFITAIMQNFTLYKGNTNDLNGHAKTNSTSSSHLSRFLAVPREDALLSVKHNT